MSKTTTTLLIKISTEFDDSESSEETIRYCVEQDLQDMGYDIEYIKNFKDIEIKALQSQLTESQAREKAAVEDLSTYKDCGFCIHLQDQQYCYKNCQRHVDVDNFRTHPCWQWRGPEEGGEEG